MYFSINEARKKQIGQLLLHQPGAANKVLKASKGVLWGGLALALILLAVNLAVPSRHLVTIRDVEQKDYLTIVFNSITIAVVGGVVSILLRALGGNLGSRDAGERVDEELMLVGDRLRYTFRTKHITPTNGRNLIVIPLGDIRHIEYDAHLSKLTLYGRFSSDAYLDYSREGFQEPASGNLSEFVFYDYFDPSLLAFFQRKN